jgi:predicted regulator of Ras-like GTPase activity (Roadblock/LC7/MglB family)
MDIVPSIWVASFAGAAFFYAGGRLWPRSRALAAPSASTGVPEEPAVVERAASHEADAEIRALRAEAARFAEEKSRIGAQATEVAAQLADLRARSAAEIGRARAQAGAAEARAAEAEQRAGGAAALQARLDEATQELTRARHKNAEELRRQKEAVAAELDRGRREVAAASARAKDFGDRLVAAEARAADADRLRVENARLHEAVAALERARAVDAPALADLQRKSAEVAMRTRVLEQRAGEVARKDELIADLSRKVEELTVLAADAEALRRRVRDLEAQGFARAAMESIPDLPPSARWSEVEGLETSLENALAEVVAHEPGCHTAVLSDARGLLIAGAGGEGSRDEIAAATALATTAADRLRELLPIGQPTSMAILDESRVVFRTRWLRYGDELFLLSTLGVRQRPLEQGADALRERLAALVGA